MHSSDDAQPHAPRRPAWHTPVALALTAFGALIALWHLAYYLPRTVDDMFIFLRYAENLVAGHGPVYNIGEPVEGFSSPLWTALLAIGIGVGLHGVVWAKVLGFAAFIGLVAGVDAFARERLRLSPIARAAAFVLLASNAYVASWTMYGLETPAYLALLAWTAVWLGRRMESPTRANAIGVACSATALCLARPEAPLYLLALGFALALEPLSLAGIRARIERSVLPALGVIGGYGSYVLFRLSYFGLLFPHTYYAKRGNGFSVAEWELVWGRGASASEVALIASASVAAIWLATRPAEQRSGATPRSFLPLAIVGMAFFFVGKVIPDWMPNVRHLLPLWVFTPLALLAAADALARGGTRQRAAAAALGVLLASTCVALLGVDSRYSQKDFRTHGRGENWVLEKSAQRWQDAHRALRGIPPEHAADFHPFHHGMITQLYRLFEADARPLAESWYLSRDIGRVGWMSPVNIFETDGLFTPAIVASEAWQDERSVDRELLRVGFDRPVVMTELLDGWDRALWSDRETAARYEGFRAGDRRYVATRDRQRPTPEQVLARYEAALSRAPSFYLITLYGECVGCALEQRVGTVRDAVAALREVPPPAAAALATFDDGLVLERCDVAPTAVAPGDSVTVRCVVAAQQAPARDWQFFVHVDGHGERINADHVPFEGLLRVNDLAPGQQVVDITRFRVPSDATPGERSVLMGFWSEDARLAAEGPAAQPDDRVEAARFEVVE